MVARRGPAGAPAPASPTVRTDGSMKDLANKVNKSTAAHAVEVIHPNEDAAGGAGRFNV